jgi:D-alanyl-D-alanine carboxypeptidase
MTVAVAVVVVTTVLSACAGGAAPAGSAVPPSPTSPSAPSGQDAFGSTMTPSINTWRTSFAAGRLGLAVPGTVVGASLGDGPVRLAAGGDAVLRTRPMAVDDAFHIGSMTKLFTAALIMQLDQEGILSLDDTINTWFPSAPNAALITVRMLLEHESGLAELDFAKVGRIGNQALVDSVFAEQPVSEPGTEYSYLNAGYVILGRIAEKAAGASYRDLVTSRFLTPLQLTGTYLATPDGGGDSSEAEPLAGYDLACAGTTGDACYGKPSTTAAVDSPAQWTGAWSAGGMVSTARDQVVWLRALVAGTVVDAAHRRLMQDLTPLSSAYYSAAYGTAKATPVQLGEGAGLAIWSVPGVGRCLGHAGSIPGSNGIAGYCPGSGLSIAILNNLNPAGGTPGYPGLIDLAPAALQSVGG